jgi:LPXTG-site transpeptidase (sortase) family protein
MNEQLRFRSSGRASDRVLVVLLVILIALFIRSLAASFMQAEKPVVTPVATVIPAEPMQIASVPARVRIPSIGVDANIQPVGQNAKGEMDTPKGENAYQDTAWYSLGARPGEIGAAVINGHLDTRSLIDPGVFRDLDELVLGDIVEVVDDQGVLFRFRVTETAVLGAADDATQVFTSDTGKAHLNLITCTGDWQQDQRQYDKRLVVFTELIK